MLRKIWMVLALLVLVVTGCAPAAQPIAGPVTVTVMVHDSFAVSEAVVKAFEKQANLKLTFIPSGDAGAMINRAVLTRDAPQADVIYGVDNTFLSRALEAQIFEPYVSPLLKTIPESFKLDPQNRALPVDYGDVCINFDKAYFARKGLALPDSLAALAQPAYKGLLVVENPATSSPGLAFLMATIAYSGPEKYLEYWKTLQANGLVVANDWETAYYTHFSGSSGQGAQPMVVSYGSSPAAEVVFAKEPPADAPTASLVADGMCFRQVEFAGILKGTKQRAAAEKVVDFLLGTTFQEDMPLQMFVYPVNSLAKLPEVFVKHAQIPQKPATLAPDEIARGRDGWIQAWKEAVLK